MLIYNGNAWQLYRCMTASKFCYRIVMPRGKHISGGGCDFHDNDYLNRIDVDDIYNDIQKYTEFLAGKR